MSKVGEYWSSSGAQVNFWVKLAGNVLRQVVKPELEQIAKDMRKAVADAKQALAKADASVAMVKELRRQMSAVMAIDVGMHEAGKIIIMSRVQNQDRVKIVDVKPKMTVAEYRQLVESLESEYGASPTWVDGPVGADVVIKGIAR